MRPNPVHQRTSRPECAPGRAPRLRQSEACGCTGAESGAAPPCSIDHSDGRDLRDRPQKKAGCRGPTAGRIEADKPSRPPTRCARGGRSHAASHMPGLAGLPAASPRGGKQTGRCQDIRGDALVRASAELCRWLCIRSPESATARPPSPAPYVQGRGYSGLTRLYMYTYPAGSEVPGGLARGARQAAR